MEDNNKKVEEVNTKAETEKPAEEEVEIKCTPLKFDDDATAMFITGNLLREKIDDLFRSMFIDYVGSILQINDGMNVPDVVNRTIQRGGIYVDLMFRENTAKGFHALKRRRSERTGGLLDAIENTIGRSASQAYLINEDAGAALGSLLPKPFGYAANKEQKINWELRKFERMSNPYGNGFMPYGFNINGTAEVILVGFPLETILKVIYGKKDDNGEYDYGCTIICDTGNRDKLFQITKLKGATVEKLYRLLNRDASYRTMGYYGNPMVNYAW